jgi:hypothetical protein
MVIKDVGVIWNLHPNFGYPIKGDLFVSNIRHTLYITNMYVVIYSCKGSSCKIYTETKL